MLILIKSSANTYISLERPRVLKNAAKIGIGLPNIPLESNISNLSNTAYLKTKVDTLFFAIKHCQNFALTEGHGAGVTVGKCMRIEIFFFFICAWRCFIFIILFIYLFIYFFLHFSAFFLLSLFVPSLIFFAFSCAFRMLGHLSFA